MLFCEKHVREIVSHIVSSEKFISNIVVEVFIILPLPLCLAFVWNHDDHISFFIVGGDDSKANLDL